MPAACSPPPSAPTGPSSWTWPASRSSPSGVNGLEPGHVPQRQPVATDARVRPVPPGRADGHLPPPRHRAEQLVIELTEREEVQDLAAAAPQRRRVPPGRDAPRGGRRRSRQRRPAAALRDPLRHRQDRPVAGPGRHPARPVPWRPARPPGAGRPVERDDRRRGRRDRRAAGRHPGAGHHRRPGLPARTAGARTSRRGARPRFADAGAAASRTAICAWWASRPPDPRAGRAAGPDVASPGTHASTIPQGALPSATRLATVAAPEIRLIDLEKRFGAVRAVDGVSIDIGAG